MRVASAVLSPLHSRGWTSLLLYTAVLGLVFQPPLSRYGSSLVLHQLPFSEPSRLVHIQETERHGNDAGARFLALHYWQDKNKTLDHLAAYGAWDFRVQNQTLEGIKVSPEFFPALGIGMQLGRTLQCVDYSLNAPPAVVISDKYWRQQLAGDPKVLSRTLRLRDKDFQIVGVLPKDFWFGTRKADLWLPMSAEHVGRDRGTRFLGVIGRLKPGVSYEQAQQDISRITGEMARKDLRQPRYVQSRMTPLYMLLWPDVSSGLMLMLLGSLAVIFYVVKNIVRQVHARVAPKQIARYWAFLTGKLLFVQVGLLLLWIELNELLVVGLTVHWTVVVLVQCMVAILFLALCAAVASWCQADQRYRCRKCLSRLRMPLASGNFGSVLFDRPGAEYICTSGCGQLYVPEARPSDEGVEQWTPSKGIWEELSLLAERE